MQRRHWGLAVLVAALVVGMASPARAADTYWQHDPATTGDWFDDANWTGGVPTSSDSGYINNAGEAEIASGVAKADLLYLGDAARTSGSLVLGGLSKLSTSTEYVGYAGTGEVSQGGAMHSVGGSLYLGYDASGEGTYILSSGDLSTDWLFVGYDGTGVFDQSSGAVAVTSVLELALGASSIGSYGLHGGELSAADEYVAQSGTAWFTHTNGQNTVAGDLCIGLLADSEGTYTISAGTLDVRDGNIQVGQAGTGTFNLNGGLVIADEVDIGWYGTFTSMGNTGTLRVNTLTDFGSNVNFAGSLQLGHAGGAGSSSYSIGASGGLSLGKDLVVGYDAPGVLTQSGGSNVVKISAGSLYLGHEAAGNGSYNLGGSLGGVSAQYEFIGHYGTGAFTQSDGYNVVEYTLYLGNQADSEGSYTLSGGSLQTNRALIGHYGTGQFIHSDGDYTNTEYVVLGRWPGGHGTYELSGGSFATTTLHVGYEGTGEFTWSGGTFSAVVVNVAAGGTMTLGQDWIFAGGLNVNGGVVDMPARGLTLDGGGPGAMMTITDGSVCIDHVTVGGSQAGSVTQTGGTSTIPQALMLGRQAGGVGSYVIAGGSLTVGDLYVGQDGQGGFGIADAAAEVTVSNLLHFGPDSLFSAVAGATIHMTGADLENESHTPTDLPGLDSLTLIFKGGPGQVDEVEVAGEDLRLDREAWRDNFALGTLQLGGAAVGRIRLVDNVDNHKPACREALYVGALVVNPGSTIDLGGLNLYFLKDDQPKQLFAGDANLDGCVDGLDYSHWSLHYLAAGGWREGDFNADAFTDGLDYNAWSLNYQAGCDVAAVPEPACALLILLVSPAILRRRAAAT